MTINSGALRCIRTAKRKVIIESEIIIVYFIKI